MKIFIIGPSKSGKTPFADRVAAGLRCPCVGASEWFRQHFPPQGDLSRQEFTDAITRFSIEVLRRDPDVNIRYLRDKRLPSTPSVVEGIRNPRDFAHLFDYQEDRVVFLSCSQTDLEQTNFEAGIGVIRALVSYWINCNLMRTDRVTEVSMGSFDEIPAVADQYLNSLEPTKDFYSRVHAEMDPPLPCYVRAEYLYDMDPAKVGSYVPGCAFAVSSYPGSVPTFQVMLDDGSVFSYLPPHALVDLPLWKQAQEDSIEPVDAAHLAYHNCPSGDFCLHSFKALRGDVQAYFKNTGRWLSARYLSTLDWYEGNDLLHLVALENGQYAFLPQHKLKFGADAELSLPPFKKLRAAWVVD